MAEFELDKTELLLRLTEFERLEALHGDVRVDLSSVRKIDVVDDALDEIHGVRIGTGMPGVVVIGTVRSQGSKAFVVVHHGYPRGVRVQLDGAEYDELIVGCDDPEAVIGRLLKLPRPQSGVRS